MGIDLSGHAAAGDCASALGLQDQPSDLQRLEPSESARLAWMEVLETGLVELDTWHKQLLQECNQLLGLVARRAPWMQIVAASALLTAKLLDHFRFEEEVMEQNGFPWRATHATEHRRIAEQLAELMARIRKADGSQEEHRLLPTSFKSILIDVLVRHDLDYRSHLLHCLGR